MPLNLLYNFQGIIMKSAMISKPKRRSQRLNRRKETLLKKAYEIGEFLEADVALILRIRKTGRYITLKSVDLESFPPSMEQIVSPN
jgi:hypothetical protein